MGYNPEILELRLAPERVACDSVAKGHHKIVVLIIVIREEG